MNAEQKLEKMPEPKRISAKASEKFDRANELITEMGRHRSSVEKIERQLNYMRPYKDSGLDRLQKVMIGESEMMLLLPLPMVCEFLEKAYAHKLELLNKMTEEFNNLLK